MSDLGWLCAHIINGTGARTGKSSTEAVMTQEFKESEKRVSMWRLVPRGVVYTPKTQGTGTRNSNLEVLWRVSW